MTNYNFPLCYDNFTIEFEFTKENTFLTETQLKIVKLFESCIEKVDFDMNSKSISLYVKEYMKYTGFDYIQNFKNISNSLSIKMLDIRFKFVLLDRTKVNVSNDPIPEYFRNFLFSNCKFKEWPIITISIDDKYNLLKFDIQFNKFEIVE